MTEPTARDLLAAAYHSMYEQACLHDRGRGPECSVWAADIAATPSGAALLARAEAAAAAQQEVALATFSIRGPDWEITEEPDGEYVWAEDALRAITEAAARADAADADRQEAARLTRVLEAMVKDLSEWEHHEDCAAWRDDGIPSADDDDCDCGLAGVIRRAALARPEAEAVERCPVCGENVKDRFEHADGSDPTGHRDPAQPEAAS